MVLGLLLVGIVLGVPLRMLSHCLLHGETPSFPDSVRAMPPGNWSLTAVPVNGTPGSEGRLLQGVWDFASKDCGYVTSSPIFPGLLPQLPRVTLFKRWRKHAFCACCAGALSISFFFCSLAPYCVLDWMRHQRYKCQKDMEARTWSNALRSIGYTLQMTVGLQVPGLVYQSYTQGPWPYYIGPHVCVSRCNSHTLPNRAPSVLEMALHLLMCLFLMDLLYFLYHRHHHRGTWRYANLLYKHVHAVHHEWRSPFAWCTQYLHAVELAATGMFSIASPVIVGAHPLTMWLWLCISIQLSVRAAAHMLVLVVDAC